MENRCIYCEPILLGDIKVIQYYLHANRLCKFKPISCFFFYQVNQEIHTNNTYTLLKKCSLYKFTIQCYCVLYYYNYLHPTYDNILHCYTHTQHLHTTYTLTRYKSIYIRRYRLFNTIYVNEDYFTLSFYAFYLF